MLSLLHVCRRRAIRDDKREVGQLLMVNCHKVAVKVSKPSGADTLVM